MTLAKLSAVGIGVAFALVAIPAGAQDGPFGFGSPGQVAISSDFSVQMGSHAEVAPDGQNPPTRTTFVLAPAVDVFVLQNFSVGGQLALSWEKSGGSHRTGFAMSPRVGYDVPIADKVSFWPKGGLAFSAWSSSDASGNGLTAFVYAPFLFHPAPHFFVGFGPWFGVGLWSRQDGNAANRSVDIALTSVVGGWF